MTGAKEPGPRGEHDISRKPLRGECRAFSGVTVVANARAFYTKRAAAGASGARHSLRPLIGEGQTIRVNLAQTCGEIAKLCSPSLRGAKATKQSILSSAWLVWIASLRSQ